jgi:hypothetical protein
MSVESAKLAINPTDIGIVDIAVYDKRRYPIRMELFFSSRCHFPQFFEVSVADQL